MNTVTHGPLYYRLSDDLVIYTCDCGFETEGYVLMEHALTAIGLHVQAKNGLGE